jgi:hypothetical protein
MKRLLFYSLVLIFVSCSSDDTVNEEEVFEPQTLTFETISQGDITSTGMYLFEESNLVIYSSDEWTELTEQMSFYNTVGDEFMDVEIDFQTTQVLVCIDKIYYNGGWSIDITEAIETENHITVLIENLNTGNLTSVVRRPFHIVKIPKLDKPVVFERIYPED